MGWCVVLLEDLRVSCQLTVQLVLGPYQTFQAQWIRNWLVVHCVKNHFRWTYFDKFMPTCLRGPVFFYETQCSPTGIELMTPVEFNCSVVTITLQNCVCLCVCMTEVQWVSLLSVVVTYHCRHRQVSWRFGDCDRLVHWTSACDWLCYWTSAGQISTLTTCCRTHPGITVHPYLCIYIIYLPVSVCVGLFLCAVCYYGCRCTLRCHWYTCAVYIC